MGLDGWADGYPPNSFPLRLVSTYLNFYINLFKPCIQFLFVSPPLFSSPLFSFWVGIVYVCLVQRVWVMGEGELAFCLFLHSWSLVVFEPFPFPFRFFFYGIKQWLLDGFDLDWSYYYISYWGVRFQMFQAS
ncbi:hypothetical protein HOY80DRAFT_190686 [Tuber brumale]|nr:hypothetical protein HOY80DRAFT_190686 [Tuber brumale]